MSLYPAVDKLLVKYQSMYNPDKYIIDINKVDWLYFMWKGVDLEQIDAQTMDCLLSGRLTGVVQLKMWYESKTVYQAKLRIYKDEHGKLSNIIIPINEECSIPDKIFNYTLSEEEKECLRTKGRLEKSIHVVIEKSKQLILPFIDNETNQVMYRSMNLVKIPNEYKGVQLTARHVSLLINGGAVRLVTDKTLEKVFIDPMSGNLASKVEGFINK